MLIQVKPIEETKWHKKTGKESFAAPKTIEVLFDSKTQRYATGLTEEEKLDFESRLKINLDPVFDYNNPHPYFSSKESWIKLPNHMIVFDTTKPLDALRVKFLKASKFVANSVEELKAQKWPEATHVIYDEEEEIEAKAGKVQAKHQAQLVLSKMSADEKIAMVQILSKKNLKGRSNNYIDVEIDSLIEDNPQEFIRVVKMGKEEVNVRAKVLELHDRNILTKEGGSFYYMNELIGIDYESTVAFFKNPDNSKLKTAILEKLIK